MLLARARQVRTDGAGHEQNHDHGGSDPERAVQVRVAVQDVEEVGARVQGVLAPAQHFGRVDVEELRVEGEGPEVAFGGAVVVGGGAGGGEGERGGGVFGARVGRVVEGWDARGQ